MYSSLYMDDGSRRRRQHSAEKSRLPRPLLCKISPPISMSESAPSFFSTFSCPAMKAFISRLECSSVAV